MLILAALEVPAREAADDYALSESRVPPCPELDEFWAGREETAAEVFARVMAGVDPHAYLDPGDLAALRARALWEPVEDVGTPPVLRRTPSAAGRRSRPAGATPRRAT
jgi:hypothetical protein